MVVKFRKGSMVYYTLENPTAFKHSDVVAFSFSKHWQIFSFSNVASRIKQIVKFLKHWHEQR